MNHAQFSISNQQNHPLAFEFFETLIQAPCQQQIKVHSF
jgi:hypothetical protein